MKTALVTGAAGFIGRHLCPKLEAAGYDVTPSDPKIGMAWLLQGILASSCAPERYDVVIHLAANILPVDQRLGGKVDCYSDMVLDLQMAEYIQEHPPRECFVYPSSCAVSNQSDPYAVVKTVGEHLCVALHSHGVPVVILRPFSGYGEDQSEDYPFGAILGRVLRREKPLRVWGSGKQVRDWIHIDDLTDAFLWAIKDAPRGFPLEIGTGVGTSIADLARMILDAVGVSKAECPVIHCDTDKPESSHVRVASTYTAVAYGFKAKISLKEGIARVLADRKAKEVTDWSMNPIAVEKGHDPGFPT